MKDYLGKEIKIGAKVVMIMPRYRNFLTGVITNITAKMVRVKLEDNYLESINQFPESVIVLPERDYSCIDCSAPLGRSCKRCQTLWES